MYIRIHQDCGTVLRVPLVFLGSFFVCVCLLLVMVVLTYLVPFGNQTPSVVFIMAVTGVQVLWGALLFGLAYDEPHPVALWPARFVS